MNEVVMKGLLKMVKNFISPDQIKEVTAGLLKKAIEYKNSIVLDKENGECQTVALFYEVNQVIYFSVAIMDADNQIRRQYSIEPLDRLIDDILNKL